LQITHEPYNSLLPLFLFPSGSVTGLKNLSGSGKNGKGQVAKVTKASSANN